MFVNSLTRDRLRIGLIIIILATVPIYCGGIVAVQYARQPTATATLTNEPMQTPTPLPPMAATRYPTFTPSLTLVSLADTPIPTATRPETETALPTETTTDLPTTTQTEIPLPTDTPVDTETPVPSKTSRVTPTQTTMPTEAPTIIITLPPTETPPDG